MHKESDVSFTLSQKLKFFVELAGETRGDRQKERTGTCSSIL